MGQRALMNVVDGLFAQKAAGQKPTLTNEMIAGLKLSGNPESSIAALKLFEEEETKFEKPTPQETAAIYTRSSKVAL
jgi:hypothetical protein